MEHAFFGATDYLVTVSEFMAKAGPNYQDSGTFPYCPSCGERVFPYGAYSPEVTQHFRHAERPADLDPLDDCHLSHRQGSVLKGLQPKEWDYSQSKIVRSNFLTRDNIAKSYCFMLRLCKTGNLPVHIFHKCIYRADKKAIWAYKNIPLWVISYILLTLFQFKSQNYAFHFVFKKPSKTPADILWSKNPVFLEKVFSDSGKSIATNDNPLPVNQHTYSIISSDTAWMSDHLLNSLTHGF